MVERYCGSATAKRPTQSSNVYSTPFRSQTTYGPTTNDDYIYTNVVSAAGAVDVQIYQENQRQN